MTTRRDILQGTVAVAALVVVPGILPVLADASIYARAGERVVCEQGHFICEFAQTVRSGQRCDTKAQFTNWQQEVPERGSRPVCATCKSHFVAHPGMILRFDQGWRWQGRHYTSLEELWAAVFG